MTEAGRGHTGESLEAATLRARLEVVERDHGTLAAALKGELAAAQAALASTIAERRLLKAVRLRARVGDRTGVTAMVQALRKERTAVSDAVVAMQKMQAELACIESGSGVAAPPLPVSVDDDIGATLDALSDNV